MLSKIIQLNNVSCETPALRFDLSRPYRSYSSQSRERKKTVKGDI